MKTIQFYKYSATGNDFIMIDDRQQVFPLSQIDLIQRMCARRTGIGADGIILVQPGKKADFRMRHFNSDGSEAEMCGNGARSVLKFAQFLGIINKDALFESMLDVHHGLINPNGIKIKMNPARNLQQRKNVTDLPEMEAAGYVEIGVPHHVLLVQDVKNVNVVKIGRELAHHPAFEKGTNVDFVQVRTNQILDMRTYERGVEDETLSCGTGATASAVLCSLVSGTKSPVQVNVPGGQLTIEFDESLEDIWLSGPVEEIYRGEYSILSL